MEMKMVQRLEIQDEIRGFSPTFTRALVDKLKDLKKKKGIDTRSGLVRALACHLEGQIFKENEGRFL